MRWIWTMHDIKYLPVARKDLTEITNYIARQLKSPRAALDLLDAFEKSISRLENFPYSHSVYQPKHNLENEYRFVPVKNYMVFYVVKENFVEIHRIVYSGRNFTTLLK